METYRIRRKTDQLFSTGGSAVMGNLQFSRRGKVFASKGALSLHLRAIEKEKTHPHYADRAISAYEQCEVLKQPLDGAATVVASVADYVQELNARSA